MELSAAPIFEEAPLVKKNGLTAGNTSILEVYYQRGYYRSQDKEELIGFTEFLCKYIIYLRLSNFITSTVLNVEDK